LIKEVALLWAAVSPCASIPIHSESHEKRFAWLGRFESLDPFRIVTRKAVAKFAAFRRCRRFVGNLKSGLPSWPVFTRPQQAGSSASSVHRLVE